MQLRLWARIFGIIYIIVGIIGFIPAISPADPANPAYHNVLGIFTVNWLHDLVHILIGVWALAAAGTAAGARQYFQYAGILLIVLFIFGLLHGFKDLFGLAPLFGADIYLHLISGVIFLIIGYGVKGEAGATA